MILRADDLKGLVAGQLTTTDQAQKSSKKGTIVIVGGMQQACSISGRSSASANRLGQGTMLRLRPRRSIAAAELTFRKSIQHGVWEEVQLMLKICARVSALYSTPQTS